MTKLWHFIIGLALLLRSLCWHVDCAEAGASQLSLEVQALLALKSGIVDSSGRLNDWSIRENDKNNVSHCSWSGVLCDQKSHKVTSLNISYMNLTGIISNDIQALSHLQILNISHNIFDGIVPIAIFNLTRLQSLDISNNNFDGVFPAGISKLRNLVNFTAFSNSFIGPLPLEFVGLPYLEQLNLGGSYFNGSIPAEYGDFIRLRYLHLSGNVLTGEIPPELGKLQELRHLEIGYNTYKGGIPWQLGNMRKLEYLDIAGANLSGFLPLQLSKLRKLNSLFLFRNNLVGFIPPQLTKLTNIMSFDLSNNMLSGRIPEGFSKLRKLTCLSLMYNNMGGSVPEGIGDLPHLEVFRIWNNSFTGMLPQRLGRNYKLRELDVSSNRFTGSIPPDLCAGGKLFKLIMFNNNFSGEIPPSLARCATLWRFRIAGNMLTGRIPQGFGSLQNFTFMDFSSNNLSGPGLPSDLCNAPRLQFINVSYNRHLGGGLPAHIWSTPSLQIFSATFSNISGKIPSFKNCNFLYKLELQGNALSGSIPEDVGHCQKLLNFQLNRNELSGVIPSELAMLPGINEIDLSHNELTGMIPERFDNCSTLEIFNVSYNRLTGPIPSYGPIFRNMSISALAGNQGLCGGVLSPCFDFPPPSEYTPQNKKPGPLVWVMGAVFALALFILIVGTRCFYKQYKWYISGNKYRTEHDEGPWKMTAFQRLNFTVEAILECLKSSNIIGMGAAGTVYKAEMPSGEVIAVKKLWRNQKEASRRRRGVLAEVDVLGNVRHRNIVRLLGCCSNNENTLLLYEYMPNGSLADLLHGNKEANMLADWMTRYKIAVGVAQGLMYLHHDCYPVVVHRDVKPSNILLDADMEARVADFGVAKLIQTDESMSVIAGSYGYIAPEYAYTLQVDEKSDIYSFGVVLLELLTGRRSVDSEFGDAINIVDWVRGKIQTKEGILQVLDQNVGASCSSVQEEMILVLRVALLCTTRCPADRPSMRDVVTMLSEAKPRRKTILNLNCLQQLQQQTPNLRSNPSSQGSSPATSQVLV
eukprot:Gb_24543 [translate_table: standard]